MRTSKYNCRAMQILQHAICVKDREYGNGKCTVEYVTVWGLQKFNLLYYQSCLHWYIPVQLACRVHSGICECGGQGGYEQCRHRSGSKLSSYFAPTPLTPQLSRPLPLYLCVVGTASICKQMGEEVEANKRQQNYMPLPISYFYDTIYCIPF